ncbi:cilia- and flagella-associated protein 70 isoform X3 [Salmo trutta]|uniref:cilia- and flagella-associated protein 70 isoform X3 n=1 Tax=Salmo trutta TaxID=8032 RepID=UPI00112FDACD|nr:cilia- and flagella-associated protein 70 isoform X3 [Salmo trutta]
MEQFRGAGDKATLVKITVLRGNNLRGNKAESILNYVRAEFNGIVLGDSQKLDAAVDQGVDYNFTCSFECSDAAHTLDDMAHKPVILTVIEVLPKEKKQKEEKTAVIGQAIVDLLPLLHGQVSFSSTVLLHPTPGSPAEAASQEGSCKPSLDVTVCVPEPLLSGVQLSDSNLLKVTVETAYSVPEVWNPVSGSGPPSSYVAALQVPLTAEAKRNISVLRESIRAPATQGRGRAPSSVGSCKAVPSKMFDGGHKGGKDTKDSPKRPGTQGKSAAIGTDSVTLVETEQQQQVNTEGQMYADSRTYIIIEIALEKSLVPKRSPEELAKRVMELIPPRAPLPRRPAGAERAVQEYQAQIASVAGQVLEQYQQLFGPAFLPGEKPLDPTSQEQRKTKLLGELNYSGKYFAFKEQIKYSVVRIVREKMLRTEAFSDPEQLQAFLSQLYVFLVDEMHVALNKTLSVDAQETQPRPLVDGAQLIHFAKEAQLNGDYQLAAQYYQEQLTRDRSDPAHWFDYGVLYMLTTDYQKAEECFHYAVSMEQTHLPSLLMCGILAEMGGRFEEAETFFEGATCVDPANVVAWTLFGLFYEGQENSIQTEMAFLEATKQQRVALVVTPPCRVETSVESPDLGEEEQEVVNCESLTIKPDVDGDTEASVVTGSQSCQDGKPGEGYKGGAEAEPSAMQHLATPTRLNTTIYMETVQFLLQNNALQMAQRALAQELLCPEGGLSSSYHLALARLQLLRAEYGSAESSLKEALHDSFQDPDVWALFGHIHHLTGEFGKAQECYERTLDFVTDATDTHPVYLRLGSIYLQEGEFQRAKTTYLRACKSSPSCLTWLGLGIACYRLGELTEAEDALTEANILNNGNAEVWGYLSLVCLQTGRRLEAEQSYKYALKLNLQKEAVLREIKALQDHVGFGNPCF